MRVRVSLSFPLLLLVFSVISHAQQPWSGVLAPARAINWAQSGVPGGIPSGSWNKCGSTIAAYSGSAATINNALAACPVNTYVLLGAGTFQLSSYIQWKVNGVALRGSGSNWNTGTRVVFGANAHSGGCNGVFGDICMISTTPNYKGGGEANIGSLVASAGSCTGSFAQGSTTICLGTQTTGSTKPSVGSTLILDQLDDGNTRAADTGNIFACGGVPACTQGGEGANARSGRAMQQQVIVTAISSGTCSNSSPCAVTISPALFMPNWRVSQSPQAWWANGPYLNNVGLEDMAIDASPDDATLGNLSAIVTYNVKNSWIRNVHIERVKGEPVAANYSNKHVRMYQTQFFTVRDSYFHGRLGTDDYGMDPWVGDNILIENNIFDNIGTDMVIEGGNAIVFSYNFTVHNNWGTQTACNPDPQPCWAQVAMDGHGAQADFNLFEGNVAVGMQPENYFGQNFFWTAFRNRIFGYTYPNIYQTVPLNLYGLSRYPNIVGNVLGTSGYHSRYDSTTSNFTDATGCNHSVYAIGLGGNCSSGDGNTWPLNDTVMLGTTMRWGNYDIVNLTNRFVSGENGSGAPAYPALTSPSSTLPASFYMNSKPSWWTSGKPWPSIGPDVSGGNVAQCAASSSYPLAPALNGLGANACGSGNAPVSANLNGQAYSNPAMDCYFGPMGGSPGGNYPTGSVLTSFDAAVCYGGQQPPPPPGSLQGTAH